ncbi:zinc finger and BTB domain-containing protein 9-like isoform X2 [Sylvia atricapilla]|uniref:zinc finger and BTB domain-containing protein 9-like isoform X2 n=1 Tax=Sylvia atricapilla TaxID=48155 RepID=UPI003390D3CE
MSHRAMAPGRVRISFPRHAPALLDSLNHLRLQGKFCDVTIHAGSRVFAAHSSVLAAASPFFHDKLLLRAGPRLTLPPAVDAGAFEGLLELIYCGRLTVAAEALPGHLLVASALQMWHVVERCSQILKELEGYRATRGHSGVSASAGNVRGHDGSSSSSSSRNVHGHERSSSSWDACDGHESIHGLDGSSSSLSSSKVIHGHDGSNPSLTGSIHGLDGSIRVLDGSSRVVHSHDGSLSSWNVHDEDESICGLDGSSRAIHGHDASLPSSSSRTIRGQEGSLSSSSRTVRVHDGPSSLWNVHDGDESIGGLDGSSPSSSSKAVHGHDGPLPSSSSSLRANQGCEGSPSSSSRTMRGPSGSSHAYHSGERSPSSSSSSLRTLCGSAAALQLNRSRAGPLSLSSWGSHGAEGAIHGDIRTIHGGDGAIHNDIVTIHDDSGTIHGDTVTVHGEDDPSSSWATCTSTEELLQLHVATTTSPSLSSQEILKIRVGDNDNDDDEGPARIPPDATTTLAMLPDPPTVYIKPEPATATATVLDIPPPAEPPLPGWTPVDLHGNELPQRDGQPVHAPVKLGTVPTDGKRFGCACGKRFAARPKRDRHILLTLSLRPFACARCPKRFKLKHHLGEHMKTHRADRANRAGGRHGAGQSSMD